MERKGKRERYARLMDIVSFTIDLIVYLPRLVIRWIRDGF